MVDIASYRWHMLGAPLQLLTFSMTKTWAQMPVSVVSWCATGLDWTSGLVGYRRLSQRNMSNEVLRRNSGPDAGVSVQNCRSDDLCKPKHSPNMCARHTRCTHGLTSPLSAHYESQSFACADDVVRSTMCVYAKMCSKVIAVMQLGSDRDRIVIKGTRKECGGRSMMACESSRNVHTSVPT